MKINMETNTRQGDWCTGVWEPLLKRHIGEPLHSLYRGSKQTSVSQASQGYIVRPCLKTSNNNNNKIPT